MDDISDVERFDRSLAILDERLRRASEQTKGIGASTKEATRLANQFGKAFSTALDGLVFKGQSLNDSMRNLALSFSRLAFHAAFRPLEKGIGNVMSGLMSGVTNSGTNVASMPDAASWAQGTSVIFNVTATDAASFARSETQIASLLARAVTTGQRNL